MVYVIRASRTLLIVEIMYQHFFSVDAWTLVGSVSIILTSTVLARTCTMKHAIDTLGEPGRAE